MTHMGIAGIELRFNGHKSIAFKQWATAAAAEGKQNTQSIYKDRARWSKQPKMWVFSNLIRHFTCHSMYIRQQAYFKDSASHFSWLFSWSTSNFMTLQTLRNQIYKFHDFCDFFCDRGNPENRWNQAHQICTNDSMRSIEWLLLIGTSKSIQPQTIHINHRYSVLTVKNRTRKSTG